jgi:hypothetical protein
MLSGRPVLVVILLLGVLESVDVATLEVACLTIPMAGIGQEVALVRRAYFA